MKTNIKIGLAIMVLSASSCHKFLDKKPDIKMAIPNTLKEADLLLNDYATLNGGYPIFGEIGNDDYYVTRDKWESTSSVDHRNSYIWADAPYTDVVQWQRPYKTVYVANQVLEVLKELDKNKNTEQYNRILGAAHFFRAFSFHQLATVYCPAYMESTAKDELGIPLRLNAGVDDQSVRASLKDSYAQIISDFKAAANYLPKFEAVIGRPFKGSAYAGLARTYLDMGDFAKANSYADSCLELNPDLLDYNTLKTSDALPIPKFNKEVLFPALSASTGIMGGTSALIDSNLYHSYSVHDLRLGIFFKPNTALSDSYFFKGSYDKTLSVLFVGLTTSEVYLIKAEAACRVGKITEAQEALNALLKARWDKNETILITETNPDKLLAIILDHRRKELVFRGRRWADLKRLNLDLRFKKDLVRKLGDSKYTLQANSPIYAYRLPETLIKLSGIPQNKR